VATPEFDLSTVQIASRFQVLFSRVVGVRGWKGDIHWRAEIHDHGEEAGDIGHYSHPIAIAWLTDYPSPIGPVLDYLIVLDHWRGDPSRHAASLVAACRQRWPDLYFTPRLNPDGSWRGD